MTRTLHMMRERPLAKREGACPPGERSPATEAPEDWIAAIASGDQDALGRLFDAMSETVLRITRRLLGHSAQAEEVCVLVFQHVWEHHDRFDPTRGTVRAWLAVLARSRSIDLIRAQGQRKTRELEWNDETGLAVSLIDEREPAGNLRAAERSTLLTQALETLPPLHRRAVEAAFFNEMTHHQVAETMGIPLGTAKSYIRRGILRLKSAMEPWEDTL